MIRWIHSKDFLWQATLIVFLVASLIWLVFKIAEIIGRFYRMHTFWFWFIIVVIMLGVAGYFARYQIINLITKWTSRPPPPPPIEKPNVIKPQIANRNRQKRNKNN